jgi:hypothetical protein
MSTTYGKLVIVLVKGWPVPLVVVDVSLAKVVLKVVVSASFLRTGVRHLKTLLERIYHVIMDGAEIMNVFHPNHIVRGGTTLVGVILSVLKMETVVLIMRRSVGG